MKVVCVNSNLVFNDHDEFRQINLSGKASGSGLTLHNTYDAEQSPILNKFYQIKGDNGIIINRIKKRFIPLTTFRENRLALLLDFD